MRACRELKVCTLAICLQLVHIFHSTCSKMLCFFVVVFLTSACWFRWVFLSCWEGWCRWVERGSQRFCSCRWLKQVLHSGESYFCLPPVKLSPPFLLSLTWKGCFIIDCWKCIFSLCSLKMWLQAYSPGPVFRIHKCDVETWGLRCTYTESGLVGWGEIMWLAVKLVKLNRTTLWDGCPATCSHEKPKAWRANLSEAVSFADLQIFPWDRSKQASLTTDRK